MSLKYLLGIAKVVSDLFRGICQPYCQSAKLFSSLSARVHDTSW